MHSGGGSASALLNQGFTFRSLWQLNPLVHVFKLATSYSFYWFAYWILPDNDAGDYFCR